MERAAGQGLDIVEGSGNKQGHAQVFTTVYTDRFIHVSSTDFHLGGACPNKDFLRAFGLEKGQS